MTSEEKEMYAVKYSAKPIKDMPVDELEKQAKALIIRIHTISGWDVPNDKYYLNILTSEFSKMLAESYKDLNIEEITYAVRNYAMDINSWGKNMNLSLIDKPISEYRRVRQCLSEAEERRKAVTGIDYKPGDVELLNMKRSVIEGRYQAFLKGQTSFAMQPVDGIETLANDGFCEADLYTDFTKNALEKIKSEMYKQYENLMMHGRVAHAEEMKINRQNLKEDAENVILLAKKMALVFCFMQFQKSGFACIYKDDIPF